MAVGLYSNSYMIYLSIDAIFNDGEQPLIQFSRSRQHSTLNG